MSLWNELRSKIDPNIRKWTMSGKLFTKIVFKSIGKEDFSCKLG